MEKKQRMFYFGTNGCAGHYALPINSDLPDVKSDDWARFDGAMLNWIEKYGTYSQGLLFGSEWSVYAVLDNAIQNSDHTDFDQCYWALDELCFHAMIYTKKYRNVTLFLTL